MLTDIEIADKAEIKPIKEIAAKIGLGEDDIEQYGKYKPRSISRLMSTLTRSTSWYW